MSKSTAPTITIQINKNGDVQITTTGKIDVQAAEVPTKPVTRRRSRESMPQVVAEVKLPKNINKWKPTHWNYGVSKTGLSNKEVGDAIGLSDRTVYRYGRTGLNTKYVSSKSVAKLVALIAAASE
jgi:hypothetical protein